MIEQQRRDAEAEARTWVFELFTDSPEMAASIVPVTIDQRTWLEAGALYALRSLANPGVAGSGPMLELLVDLRSRLAGPS